MTQVHVETLGCFPMDAAGGTTLATAEANAAAINAYLGGGYRPSRLPLFFPGRGWLIGDTIDLAEQTGHALHGAGGEPIWHNENQYNIVPSYGGPVSRIVAHEAFASDSEPDGRAGQPVIRIPGYGNHIQQLALQGLWSTGSLPTGEYPFSGLEIDNGTVHASDERAWIGIEILPTDGGPGTGKLACPGSLAIMFCRAAVKCSGNNNEYDNHADQLFLGRFLAAFCDIGLWVTNRQSVGHRIGYFDQVHCHTALRFDAGGKLWCGDLVMQDDSEFGLLLTGNDASIGGNAAAFRIDRLTVDGTTPLDCQAVHVEPTSGSCFACVDIGFLHVDVRRPGADPIKPLFEINDYYGDLNIYGGVYLYQSMIKVTGGTDQFFPTIRIHNARFAKGHHSLGVFLDTGSTGYVQLEIVSCCEMNGSSGSLNQGKMFPDFRGLINFANSPFVVEAGGFIFRTGKYRSESTTITATPNDEVIEMTGSGTTVNLVTGQQVRGITYHIYNSSGGNVTVAPSSPDTINGSSSLVLGSGNRASIFCSGTNWMTL
jgi:hypothetical protein